MNDDFLKKVALLQLKEKVMKDSGDVLTDLADMQALRQFSAELKELIDEQHAAGAIPANPLAALRERLMKVVDAIKGFKSWQEEQLKELAPFRKRNPKVSLRQINSMISALPLVMTEEQESIGQLISSCDSQDWDIEGKVINLRSELEAAQEALLPEFAKLYVYDKKWSPELTSSDDSNKGYTLKQQLGAEIADILQKLVERHKQQAAAVTELESQLQLGNYRTAQAKAKEAELLNAEGKNQVGFTDIDFAKQAGEIGKCDKLVGNLKRHLTSNNSYNRVIGKVMAYDLYQAEPMLNDARGEFREDLSAAAGSLKAKITKAKKEKKTMMIMIASGVIVILLLVAFSIYSEREKAAEQEAEKKAIAEQRAAEEEALAEQLAADEKALAVGDLSVVDNVAEHALLASELTANPSYQGWVKSEYSNGKLRELYHWSNGKKNGFEICCFWDGKQMAVGSYKDGKKHGLNKQWFIGGQKRSETNYKDGKQHGLATLYQENGQKKQEANYADGEKNGLRTLWYENGQKRFEANYADGELHGLWTRWHENGQKRYVTNYVDGKNHGLMTGWDEEGNVTEQTKFKNGVEVK